MKTKFTGAERRYLRVSLRAYFRDLAHYEGYRLSKRELNELIRVYITYGNYKDTAAYIYGMANGIKKYMNI